MRAGRLRHRVDLQHVTETQDSTGDPVRSYSTYATVWASIEPVSGREYYAAQQAGAVRQHKIVIRSRRDVAPTDRVMFGSRIFEVEAVLHPAERNIETHLMCKELV